MNFTYEPLNTLKKVDENIWIIDGEVIKMKVLALSVPFSTRMTIIKLKNGKLWCYSPIEPTQQLLKEVNQLGEVGYLISPNKLHYAYIQKWQKEYPLALTYASPGVKKRSSSKKHLIHFTHELQNHAPDEWEKEIEQLIFKGSPILEEVVFFHKGSKTLILADLIENFEGEKIKSRFWGCVHKIGRIAAPDGQTPLDYRLSFINKKEARKNYKQMLNWKPEKIIIAHGRWFEKNGVEELRRAFRWLD
ncbi:MAG: DUF4336 domain-containing protein [Defluviitaleaceae bacterium]|nr:DUF4336 domain-containing protein [Defluviitaleaceae bacterium]